MLFVQLEILDILHEKYIFRMSELKSKEEVGALKQKSISSFFKNNQNKIKEMIYINSLLKSVWILEAKIPEKFPLYPIQITKFGRARLVDWIPQMISYRYYILLKTKGCATAKLYWSLTAFTPTIVNLKNENIRYTTIALRFSGKGFSEYGYFTA